METIRELAEETLEAVNKLRKLLGDTATLDDTALEKLVSKTVVDLKTRARILLTARWNGGVRQMFETAVRQLSLKQQTYADALGVAQRGDVVALKAAFLRLEKHDVAMERLREKWKDRLKESKKGAIAWR